MTNFKTHKLPAPAKLFAGLGFALVAVASPVFSQPAFAADMKDGMKDAAHAQMESKTADFVRFNKTLKGQVEIVERDGQTVLRFSDSFRASNGPDLKVFLSPQGLDTVSGKTATNGAVKLGLLESTKGAQEYVLPAGVNLSQFGSVLIHCEQFSVLWGGATLS